MLTYTLIAALAGASLVLANPAPAAQITPAPLARREAPARREVSTETKLTPEEEKCADKYWSLVQDQPSQTIYTAADQGLVNFLQNRWKEPPLATLESTKVEEKCTLLYEAITPPAPLASAYSSWMSAESAWASSKSALVNSIASSCDPKFKFMFEALLITDTDSCITVYRAELSSTDATTTTSATSSATSTATSTSTSVATGGAARETGMVVAAVAAVAVVGAMAGL
ncbi:hypothetical protein QBC43DRAFT_325370 [Cladorrhinum sp. PSN259]|nr:hypothetical protein QBC43DRAFT_325370 [Cladorrhinum sp. PSN259]